MSKRDLIIIWVGIITLLAITIRQNFVNSQRLRGSGIVIRSFIYNKAYVKGASIYSVKYLFKGKVYENDCRSSRYNFNIGDSINIKVDSLNPNGYSVIEATRP